MIKFGKSDGGYIESKCGRFSISPQFMGRTTAQAYTLDDKLTGHTVRHIDTQRDAKEQARSIQSHERLVAARERVAREEAKAEAERKAANEANGTGAAFYEAIVRSYDWTPEGANQIVDGVEEGEGERQERLIALGMRKGPPALPPAPTETADEQGNFIDCSKLPVCPKCGTCQFTDGPCQSERCSPNAEQIADEQSTTPCDPCGCYSPCTDPDHESDAPAFDYRDRCDRCGTVDVKLAEARDGRLLCAPCDKIPTVAVLVADPSATALVPTAIRVARRVVDGEWAPQGDDARMFARALVALADAVGQEKA